MEKICFLSNKLFLTFILIFFCSKNYLFNPFEKWLLVMKFLKCVCIFLVIYKILLAINLKMKISISLKYFHFFSSNLIINFFSFYFSLNDNAE